MVAMTDPTNVKVVAWDPSLPLVLRYPDYDGVHTAISDYGIGCNNLELEAIFAVIDAFEHAGNGEKFDMDSVFQKCRQAVTECIFRWREDSPSIEDSAKIDKLETTYAILHLSHVIVPLLGQRNNNPVGSVPFHTHGIATAGMVRCLRYNFIKRWLDDAEELMKLENADSEEAYWPVLQNLVETGCLSTAWELLSCHQLCRAAVRAIESPESSMTQEYLERMTDVYRSFTEIREILLFAPIPGGRTDEDDNIGEAADGFLDDEGEFSQPLQLHSGDFRLWETHASLYGDFPLDFQASRAKFKVDLWRDCIKQASVDSYVVRTIPELARIMNIIQGNFEDVQFHSWTHHLIAELIYKQPDIRPDDIVIRAQSIHGAYASPDTESDLLDPVFAIMGGNAVKALELLHQLGGGSRAALPATLLAVVFSVFAERDLLPDDDERTNHVAELLSHAAESLVSSFQDEKHDVGVTLALRLLVPHAQYLEAHQVRSTVASLLEHYAPSTINHAQRVFSICEPLISMKCHQTLAGVSAVRVSVFQKCMKTRDFKNAIITLAEGSRVERQFCGLGGLCIESCQSLLRRYTSIATEAILQFCFDGNKNESISEFVAVGSAVSSLLLEEGDFDGSLACATPLSHASSLIDSMESESMSDSSVESLFQLLNVEAKWSRLVLFICVKCIRNGKAALLRPDHMRALQETLLTLSDTSPYSLNPSEQRELEMELAKALALSSYNAPHSESQLLTIPRSGGATSLDLVVART